MNSCNFIEDSVKALLKASHIPTSVLGGSKRTKPSKDDPQWVAGHTFFRRASVIYRLLKPLCLPQSFHANRYREERHDELHGDEGFNEGFFFCEMLVLVLLFLASGVTTHVSGIL